jgi:hypothetical protein
MLPAHLLARTRLDSEPLQQPAAAAFSEEAARPRHQDPHLGDLVAQLLHLLSEAALGLAQAVCLVNPSQLSDQPPVAAFLVEEEDRRPDLEQRLHQLVLARVQHRLSEAVPMLQTKELARYPSRNSQRKTLLPPTQPIAIKPFLQLIHTSNGRWKNCD